MYPTAVILLVEISNKHAQRTLCMDDIPTLPIHLPQASSRPEVRTRTSTVIDISGDALNVHNERIRYSSLAEPSLTSLSIPTSAHLAKERTGLAKT